MQKERAGYTLNAFTCGHKSSVHCALVEHGGRALCIHRAPQVHVTVHPESPGVLP